MDEGFSLAVVTVMYSGENEIMDQLCRQKDGVVFPIKMFHNQEYIGNVVGKTIFIREKGFDCISYRAVIAGAVPVADAVDDLRKRCLFEIGPKHKMFVILDNLTEVPPRTILYQDSDFRSCKPGENLPNPQAGLCLICVNNKVL